MKRILAAALCLLALIAAAPKPLAAGITVSAPSAVLMHESGKVLFEKDAHKPLAPASVTKIMTLLLTMEAIESGKISYDSVVTASKRAASMHETQIFMTEGEQFTVHELIKCVAIRSANDAAIALAEYIAGTEEMFVERMNERARELGMVNTTFKNCHGLDAEGHLTTAYDIALMSNALMQHEKIKEYTLTWQDSVRDGTFDLTNTNRMIRTYDGITGLKTGLTNNAGFCLSATATRGGLSLVSVVMKCDSVDKRTADSETLLNYGFANYASVSLTPDAPLMPVKVLLGKQSQVALKLADDTAQIYEKSKLAQVEKQITLESELFAPVAEGQIVGELTVRAGDEIIASIPIITVASIERQGLWDIFLTLLRAAAMKSA